MTQYGVELKENVMRTTTRRAKARRTTVGQEIIAALREALHAAQTGDYSGLRVREVEITEPREYGPAEVKALRTKLGVTQNTFARLMGVSPQLIAHWEYDIRKPAGIARRLMDRIDEDPARYLAAVVKRREANGRGHFPRKKVG